MRADTAKHNHLIREQAIKYYLNQGKPTPEFTFISLWNDAEPYPLAEVIIVLNEHLNTLNANFKDSQTEMLRREIEACSVAYERLVHLQDKYKNKGV